MAQGGGSLLLETEGTSIGPGHAGIIQEGTNFWMSLHFYDGNDRGRSKLVIHRLTWDELGWPVVLKD
jgi:arabinan endo-1,5-alpha-L-arabinosidase